MERFERDAVAPSVPEARINEPTTASVPADPAAVSPPVSKPRSDAKKTTPSPAPSETKPKVAGVSSIAQTALSLLNIVAHAPEETTAASDGAQPLKPKRKRTRRRKKPAAS